jgi:TetR/AcrR family transcriptional repressor of nem operon
MENKVDSGARRGRPRKAPEAQDTRQALLRVGLRYLTEKGYSSVGVDEVLVAAGATKGSFYYHFGSKEAFGAALIASYDDYFRAKLMEHFRRSDVPPLDRLRAFVADAQAGMVRHGFTRGCLIGNLGQEMGALPEAFRDMLREVLEGWQALLANLLEEASEAGQLRVGVVPAQAAAFFWTGWEGAVLRAKLDRSAAPLQLFANGFFALIEGERV